MHWILKPFMKTAAYAKLTGLYEEKDRIEKAIQRAKKSKAKVTHLYEMAQNNNIQCLKWERWLT
jgi:Pyruvate/2-oxoacid:ferredoxin oxidoreductase gamma subunit